MCLGERDCRTADAENNLGLVYTKTGFAGEANYCLNKALTINESLFGKDSINCAVNLHNLATLKSNLAQYREAESLFKTSLNIKSRVSPQSHTQAVTLLELSDLYRKQNRLQLSESVGLQALKIYQLPQYRDSLQAALCMNNLAATENRLGKIEEAQKLYSQALQIANRSLGADSHLSTIYRLNLQNIATKNTKEN
ncbi:MAG: tetratricopeptide repeat protein [Candidatus Obscuribacter sp.]|nr:tetratricopeptide repeat protein [Candidatus Obscuribacter sp.]MBP6592801.1 tetratricopeptide repeat protein [Candidatus Obscuribacter sp.]